MSWDWQPYYRKSTPRKVTGGLRLWKNRGEIADSWWGKRWIEVLESFGWHTRLERGRRYARGGQVASIQVEPGAVLAQVQGSKRKPYEVRIALHPFSRKDWGRILDALAGKAYYSAKLLSGEMPQEIEQTCRQVKLWLFPRSKRDLSTDCSCPDWENPCKHIAAAYYILAQEFDRDPFLLFKIRGLSRQELLSGLRSRRKGGEGGNESDPDRLRFPGAARTAKEPVSTRENLADRAEDFFRLGKDPSLTRGLTPNFFERLPKPGSRVKELGVPPFWQGEMDFKGTLTRCYQAVRHRSLSLMSQEVRPTGPRREAGGRAGPPPR
ncbi:MAG: SWIM zinc finger family protein [Candidatus Omnitrophica bacterium]|nr:SWIM zinc finger family protein [Candidatus Omnitrophota bacterium]